VYALGSTRYIPEGYNAYFNAAGYWINGGRINLNVPTSYNANFPRAIYIVDEE
jgi:hypothetical protein